MTAGPRVVLIAPAKVNLYLGVGSRRADGYHDVETVLQSLSLADTVTIEPADSLSVECMPGIGIPAEENLAYRAAVALGEAVDRSPSVRISLKKRIPAGGGLGGASSDAAAVLVGLADLWRLAERFGDAELEAMLSGVAASLGADVPFFIGGGTALFGDRGDALVRRLPTPDLEIVLVKPEEPVPTGAAYAAFDRSLQPSPPGPTRVTEACVSGEPEAVARALYNNMTEPAISLVASIGEVAAWCRGSDGVLGVALAGSGSTVFAVCEDGGTATGLATAARARGWWAEAVRTNPGGVIVLDREGAFA